MTDRETKNTNLITLLESQVRNEIWVAIHSYYFKLETENRNLNAFASVVVLWKALSTFSPFNHEKKKEIISGVMNDRNGK
jgi:hypothetical protein